MNKLSKILILLLVIVMLVGTFAACGPTPDTGSDSGSGDTNTNTNTNTDSSGGDEEPEFVDYASQLKFNPDSGKKWAYVTVKSYIDGDTTHFYIDKSEISEGFIKARYLGINTPESTGKIEEYGKAAATFTRSKLEKATSIIIESDTDKWEADSTGGRFLAWVWYKTADSEDYRNLNIEILQNGLAIASNSGNNRYGQTCLAAIDQAKANKLHVYSGQRDPDFYYGEAIELTLKELRANISSYANMKVAFTGVITVNDNNTIFVEQYDSETDMYYGVQVYLGFNLQGDGLDIVKVGNESRIVGTVTYYEGGGTWQVSGLSYRAMKPDDPNNIQKISEGNSPAYMTITPEQ